tara:strand:- start:1724 stop:2365 length:642 start_codon:yes stop_codon:yes gene_type:complete
MSDFLERLKKNIERGVPGVEAHKKLLPIKLLKKREDSFTKRKEDGSYRDSAVSIILYPHLESIYCILIKRPEYEGKHSGQISFPGGKFEDSDLNFEYTARREAFEEVGFPIKEGELITALSQLYIPISNFLVHPFLFFTSKKPELIPDQREVEKTVEFDIFDLLKPENQSTKDIQIEKSTHLKNIPYFNIQGNVVWGATAMILSELKMILKDI